MEPPVQRAAEAVPARGAKPYWRDAAFFLCIAAAWPVWLALACLEPPRWPPELLGPPWRWLALIALYPVLEELVFRGGLQGWLLERPFGRRRWLGVSAANALTSAAFASVHLFSHEPLWALATVFPSLVFGFLRERHASVAPCIWMHAYYNLGYFLLWN